MALAFAGALGLAVSERVSGFAAKVTLGMALVVAVLSAVMPLSHGHLGPWAVVQWSGMVLMLWLALQPARVGALGVRVGWLIGLFALAYGLRIGDDAILRASGEMLSGDSLKHVAAALAAWPVFAALRQNAREAAGRRTPHDAG
jgi:hypothetical protein